MRHSGLFKFLFTPHKASPPIQFDRIASAARRVIAPRGSGIKGKANTSPIGSCLGYPPIPYLPRPYVCSQWRWRESFDPGGRPRFPILILGCIFWGARARLINPLPVLKPPADVRPCHQMHRSTRLDRFCHFGFQNPPNIDRGGSL